MHRDNEIALALVDTTTRLQMTPAVYRIHARERAGKWRLIVAGFGFAVVAAFVAPVALHFV